MKHYADVNAHHFHLDTELYRFFYSNEIENSACYFTEKLKFHNGKELGWGGVEDKFNLVDNIHPFTSLNIFLKCFYFKFYFQLVT